MATPVRTLLGHLLQLTAQAAPDAALLARWVEGRDESAFATLVARHGPMVLAACRRVLGDWQHAEDAFQATFLVLARKARKVRRPEALASYLYAVALRLARKASARRRGRMAPAGSEAGEPVDPRPQPLDVLSDRELLAMVDAEVARLPEVYRLPVLLCVLQERSVEDAARILGWTTGLVRSRLARGRQRLRQRLTDRGLASSGGALALLAPAKVPHHLLASSLRNLTNAAPAAISALVAGGKFTLGLKTLCVTLALTAFGLGAGLPLLRAPEPLPQVTAAPPALVKEELRRDRYGDPLPRGAIMRLGTAHLRQPSSVQSIAFTADGKHVVSAGAHEIRVWEMAKGNEVRRFDAINLMGLAVSSTGGILAAAQNGNLQAWDLGTWKPRFNHEVSTFAVAISPNGSVLASGGRSTSDPVVLWDVRTGKRVRSLSGSMPQVTRLTFSPDGKWLAAASCWNTPFSPPQGSRPEIVRLWDMASGQLHELAGHARGVTSVAFAPDGKVLATGDHQGMICFWDTATRKRLSKIKLVEEPYFHRKGNGIDSGGVLALVFTVDGKILASGNYDSTVRLWEASTGKQLGILRGHADSVGVVALSPDGKILASGSDDQTIRLWDLATGKFLNPRQGHDGGVGQVLITPDGKRAVSAGSDRTIRFWDLTTGNQSRDLCDFKTVIHSISLSPDGTMLAVGLDDGCIQLRDAESCAQLRELKGHTGQVCSVSFSPDGMLLASTSPSGKNSNLARKEAGRSLRLWDANSGRELARIGGNRNDWYARFSPDGKWLAVYGQGVELWEVATGKMHRRLGDLDDFAFLPDSKTIAGWSVTERSGYSKDKGVVRVRNLADGSELSSFPGPDRMSWIGGLFVLSPDGRLLALSAGDGLHFDQNLQLWEMATGKLRRTLKGHGGAVKGCAFSANGCVLLSASSDTTILVWDLALPLQQRPKDLGLNTLASLWRDLGDADAVRADQAIWTLIGEPHQTVPFLQMSLPPRPAPDPTRLAGLLSDLNSEQFSVRDRASKDLDKLGELASPVLREALARPVTLETRRRIEALLSRLKGPLVSSESIRDVRAVEVLEHIDTPESRKLLVVLAQGAAGARLTEEAKASLQRLTRRAVR